MVTDKKKDSRKTPVKQGPQDAAPEPNKINASTPYDFNGKNLTPYGGLLPAITVPAVWQWTNPSPLASPSPSRASPSPSPPRQFGRRIAPKKPSRCVSRFRVRFATHRNRGAYHVTKKCTQPRASASASGRPLRKKSTHLPEGGISFRLIVPAILLRAACRVKITLQAAHPPKSHRRLSTRCAWMDKPEAYPTYWVTVRRPVWVRTPPTLTTTGCTPRGAVAGTVKLTCETPARPIGVPAKETVAAIPPTVTVTASFGRGSLAVVVPVGGLAPGIRNVVVSPSPVMKATAVWPCRAVADGVSEPSAAVNRPGAAGATVKGKLETWPLLLTPKTARPIPVS